MLKVFLTHVESTKSKHWPVQAAGIGNGAERSYKLLQAAKNIFYFKRTRTPPEQGGGTG